MPSTDLSQGKYTIEQVLNFTAQGKFKTRFDNAKRDRVKVIKIKEVKVFTKQRPTLPTMRYVIESQSVPQYRPYAPSRDKRGRYRRTQRSVTHEYDTIFVFGNEGITLTTKKWATSVGSMKKVPKKVPQYLVAQIHKETRERLVKKYGKNSKKYKEEITKIKKRAKYLSDGDYIGKVLKINLDWIYRFAFAFWKANHLYGRNYYGNVPARITNPQSVPAFTKHQIIVIKELMKQGILTK